MHVYPSSVNHNVPASLLPSSWLCFHSRVRSSRVFIHDSTPVSTHAVLLFGGDMDVRHAQRVVVLDGWVKLDAPPRTAVLFRELRKRLEAVLLSKLRNPHAVWSDPTVVDDIVQLLSTTT